MLFILAISSVSTWWDASPGCVSASCTVRVCETGVENDSTIGRDRECVRCHEQTSRDRTSTTSAVVPCSCLMSPSAQHRAGCRNQSWLAISTLIVAALFLAMLHTHQTNRNTKRHAEKNARRGTAPGCCTTSERTNWRDPAPLVNWGSSSYIVGTHWHHHGHHENARGGEKD